MVVETPALKPLSGKVALVTGGGRRIGAAICRALATQGATVAVHYLRSEAEAIAHTRVLGNGVFAIRGDLATTEGCRRVIEEAHDWTGRLDILVNNAALFYSDDAAEADLARMEAVNLAAPLYFMQWMHEHKQTGAIVNLLDQRIIQRPEQDAPFTIYTCAKRTLATSIPELARRYAPGLRVTGIAPGAVLAPEGVRDTAGSYLLARRPMPEDVANAVCYLAAAEATTGQVLFVDSGQCLGRLNPSES